MSLMEENFRGVQARIDAACARSGRSPSDIKLIWVSKNHPQASALEALALGARHFGENRVQEALEKFPLPSPGAYELHLIGRLQKNKIRKILPLVSAIHSVDSVELLLALNRVAGELGLKRDVFLQVNTSREMAKGGFSPEALRREMEALPWLHNLRLAGLMTMGPAEGTGEDARICFRELAGLAKELRERRKVGEGRVQGGGEPGRPQPMGSGVTGDLAWLSMGMTADFEIAIEEGAHFLRIGTGLFGARVSTPVSEGPGGPRLI